VTWLLLAFYAVARGMGRNPSTIPLLYLCPSSIMTLGLDDASWIVSALGWLLISLNNALLYSLPGILVSFFFGWGKSD
jgi:hypothetical protein